MIMYSQDMNYTHKNKETLNRIERKDITEYVRIFLLELAEREKRPFIRLTRLSDADRIKGLLNIPKNTIFKSIADFRTGIPYWEKQEVDFVASNLGRGYLFYFICNRCGRRVKYLYDYIAFGSPLCRTCCQLNYKAPSRKARELSRLIRKPYLSNEAKYMLIKRAGITKEDIPDELENESKK